MFYALPMSSGRRRFTKKVLSKEYRHKREQLVYEVWQQTGGRPVPMTGDVQVSYTITPRDRRMADVDAYEKALLDGLQIAGVYVDDKQVVQVSKERMPEPKHPGGITVEIREIAG
jgi:Holliday junction resolvase RusA-like endonuclease